MIRNLKQNLKCLDVRRSTAQIPKNPRLVAILASHYVYVMSIPVGRTVWSALDIQEKLLVGRGWKPRRVKDGGETLILPHCARWARYEMTMVWLLLV
jgi:hypothetical protein